MPDRPRKVFGKIYILTKNALNRFYRLGPPQPPTYDYEEIKDIHKGETIYIIAPGTSLNNVDPSIFDGKLTIAINSAGFWRDCTYWSMAEGGYAMWAGTKNGLRERYKDKFAKQKFLLTCRAALIWIEQELPFRNIFITRHEEEKTVPRRIKIPAVTTINTIASAWWMGCSRAVLFGLDLSKRGGPYVKGVPYTQKGAKHGYKPQVEVLKGCIHEGLEIFNVNDQSNGLGLPFMPTSMDRALEELSK